MNEFQSHCIYKHTFPNGKVYIGMTESPTKRFGTDGIGYKSNAPMYSDIEKYGWKNIKTEILKCDLSFEEAQQQEREFILAYNSEDSNFGYNQTNYRKMLMSINGHEIEKEKSPERKPIASWGSNIDFSKFIKPEIDYIRDNGNLNKVQLRVFELRANGLSLEECANEIGLSLSTIKRTSSTLRKKIIRLMQD